MEIALQRRIPLVNVVAGALAKRNGGCDDDAMADKPRLQFRLSSALLATAVVAVWLSTLNGYAGSNDIQAFIWMAVLVTSGIAAASSIGRRRAFWAGFCSTMLLISFRPEFAFFGSRFSWTRSIAVRWAVAWNVGATNEQMLSMRVTLLFVMYLAFATAIGVLSVVVYDRCTRQLDAL